MAETATTAPGQHCCIGLNKCGDAWLKSWNSVVEASDLKMLQSYYKNSAPFFKIYFCLCSPVMRRSRWLKAPIIPSPPSFLPTLVTAPLLQPPAAPASSPLCDQYSLSLWGQTNSKPLQAFVSKQAYKNVSNTSFGIITSTYYIDVLAVLG